MISTRRSSMHVAIASHKFPSHREPARPTESRITIMAYPKPPFRPAFPLLLVSGLLLAQPVVTLAAAQVECRAGSGGSWVCTPMKATAELPPRPGKPVVRAAEPEPSQRVSDTRPSAAPPQTKDFSKLDWVPRDQLAD